MDVLPQQFPSLRVLWDIALNELRTETIVESVCSVIKKIYADNREGIEYVILRMKLPKNHSNRDKIVKMCGQIFEVIKCWRAGKSIGNRI